MDQVSKCAILKNALAKYHTSVEFMKQQCNFEIEAIIEKWDIQMRKEWDVYLKTKEFCEGKE